MNPELPHRPIHIVEPAVAAFARMKTVLFQPFDLARWLAIGFCAFLATLGEYGASGGVRFRPSGDQKRISVASANEVWNQAETFMRENALWVVPAVAFAFLIGLLAWLLVLWLSSRGRFMFLDNVATNQAEVVRPWKEHSRVANSLFFLRLLFAGAGGLILLLCGALGAAAAIGMIRRGDVHVVGVGVSLVAAFLALILGFALLLVSKLTKDFVVPVMWLRETGWQPAWREIGRLIAACPGSFVLYLLFYLLLLVTTVVALAMVIFLTCCLAGCLLAIPYVGIVILLPVLVFFRAYPLYFLAQFGPDYDVLDRKERRLA